MNIDPIAREASRALRDAAADVDPPEITDVRKSRNRRSGLAVAATAFAVTIAAVGGFALTGESEPDVDVAGPESTAPATTDPTDVSVTSIITDIEPSATLPAPSDTVYAGNVFVLDDGMGPEVCSAVMESLPPQCSGTPLDGLDWTYVPWAESSQGVTWADMYVEVTFVDGRLKLEGGPTESRRIEPRPVDFTPPCEPPDGGWVFTHGPGTSNDNLEAALRYAQGQPAAAGSWVFNLDPSPSEFEAAEMVVVAGFTSDVAVHRAAMEERWSGPLCVFERANTEAELRTIQNELAQLAADAWHAGIGSPTSFSVDVTTGTVEVGVLFATDEGIDWLAGLYGRDLVKAVPQLQPVTPPG